MTEKLHTAASDTFRSLRVRNFRLFFTGQLISQTGSWLTMITQTLLVLHLTHSGVALGLLTASQFGPMLFLGAWAGAVADRADKRKLLLVTQAIAMGQSVVLGLVVLAGWATVPVIFALAAVQGVVTAFDNPARRAFVVEMVSGDDLANAVSLNSAVMTASRVVGPALAGALVLATGYGWPFLLDAATYTAVIAGLWMMRTEELFRGQPTPKRKGAVREGLRYIKAEPQLYVPLVMMTIVGTLAFNFSVTVPLLVNGPLHGDNTTFTLLFSVLSAGSLVGALWTARRTAVTARHLNVAALGFGITMFLLAAAPNLGLAFAASIALGVASVGFLTASTAIVQMLAAPEFRGRVLAIQAMVFLGSTPIGGPIVGWLSDVWGPRAGLAVGAVACLVAAAYGHHVLGSPRPGALPSNETATVDDAVALAD